MDGEQSYMKDFYCAAVWGDHKNKGGEMIFKDMSGQGRGL